MATYQRSVTVEAPFERVWEFHSGIEGLVELTPDWLDLRIESVRGPDGAPTSGVLETGSEIRASLRPLGVGPRQHWTSVIVAREEGPDHAMFRDVMEDGPFPRWEHTHRFVGHDGRTEVVDRVEYALPGGPVGRVAGPLAVIGFEPMFRYRHRHTKAVLEPGPDG